MYRYIKFRAWDKKKKTMAFVKAINYSQLKPGAFSILLSINEDLCQHHWRVSSEDCILLQYTGIHDIKGKEIYDGDIVIFDDDSILFVSWDVSDSMFSDSAMTWFIRSSDKYMLELYPHMHEVEVIGNIYENSNLLSKNI